MVNQAGSDEDFELCVARFADPLSEIAGTKRIFKRPNGEPYHNQMLFWKLLNTKGILTVLGYSEVDEKTDYAEPVTLRYYEEVIKKARNARGIFYWIQFLIAVSFYVCAAIVYGKCFLLGIYCNNTVCYAGFVGCLTTLLGACMLCYKHCRLVWSQRTTGLLPTQGPNLASVYVANVGLHLVFTVIFICSMFVVKDHTYRANLTANASPDRLELPQGAKVCVSPVFEFCCTQITVFFLFTFFQIAKQTWQAFK
ncbi:ORF115 [Ranid herpesvirus 2]|uniref:ORF115 n=1 Tax=Ranid herpesvirus 2 TaxID=389214 RepID=Q14VZ1_9VIRU|nr:ORF115 [Ranid herpesvirus 2]ABG25663.1 ORF115 [Ranid herpesvirus 2]